MYRCSDVVYNPVLKRLISVPGLTWDDVYAALQPHVVNGQVSGVGIAGLIVGGGSLHFIHGFPARS
jgi:hypothetical protein